MAICESGLPLAKPTMVSDAMVVMVYFSCPEERRDTGTTHAK
jgi:hypothetical protein